MHAANRSTPSPSVRAAMLSTACLAAALAAPLAGCNTAPKYANRQSFALEAKAAEGWFDENVSGFREQIRGSGGYIIFPDVGEWGVVFVGGTFGRGGVYDADGTQIGWAAINRTGVGLTLGAQGQKIAIVLKDEETMRKFKQGTWSGDVAATVVAAQEGAAAAKQFKEGVVVYVGDQAGLMAGLSIALSHVRYKSLADLE
jgi:lipid-binding SYLF domain-containing protein